MSSHRSVPQLETLLGLGGRPGESPARRVVAALCRSARSSTPPAQYDEWLELYARLFGPHSSRQSGWVDTLSSRYEVAADDGRMLLFAVHTCWALVVKAATARLVGVAAELPADNTRTRCERLEDDETWRHHGADNFLEGDLFDWYLDGWTSQLEQSIGSLFDRLDQLEVPSDAGGADRFRDCYQALLPGSVRHDLGEFYTPRWLADLTLDQAGYTGADKRRILDPACGSGIFLVAAIERIRRAASCEADNRWFAARVLDEVTGFDINPLAVLAARANVLCAVAEGLDPDNPVEIPVYRRDALPARGTVDLFAPTPADTDFEPFDLVVGNPPWVNWEHLPEDIRRDTRPLWQGYGLFSLSGTDGRYGGGKKDLSMLFVYACTDEYLRDGGTLAMLITRSVFKSKGAGDGFRRFRYDRQGRRTYLQPLEVHDFTDLQPFENATTQTALLCAKKSTQPFDYPVPYHVWEHEGPGRPPADAPLEQIESTIQASEHAAQPVDPDYRPSPWLTAPAEALPGIEKVIGSSDYTAREGVNSGGLNGCFWVRELDRDDEGLALVENLHNVGRIHVDKVRCKVESDRLYSLLRSGDVNRWSATPRCSILLGQDPDTRAGVPEDEMKSRHPKTYEYFQRFEGNPDDPQRGTLRGRSLFRRYFEPSDPFYSMYGVGPYTMKEWKVCWTRIDTRLRAAVVGPDGRGRPVLPQETITFVPFDAAGEAHYFCAAFNSAPADALVRCHSSGKGFASAHILDTIAIPTFENTELHRRLSALSRQCHDAAQRGDDKRVEQLETQIDEAAGELWDISPEQLEAIREALPGL